MISISKESKVFLIRLFTLLVFTFGVHILSLFLLNLPLFSNLIVATYIVNFILAAIVLHIVERSLGKKSSQAGLIFMVGSFIKFIVFFIFFYPTYVRDSELQTVEFTTFFIPYAMCLILEVYYLSKQLNRLG